MVHRALEAAETLSKRGIEAEVLDLRTLVPLDSDSVVDSVRKTGRMIIVDEDYMTFGLSGEVIAAVVTEDPALLKAPARRVGNPGVPIPYAESLEGAVIPDADSIVRAVEGIT